MRAPITIYTDPIDSRRVYMLRQDDSGRWCIMSRNGQSEWEKVDGQNGSMHKFVAEEQMKLFVYDNGLHKEIMDEELAGI